MRPQHLAPLLLALMVSACQNEVFPDAPTAPTKNPVASTPTNGLPFAAPHDNGQLAASHGRYLEFVPARSNTNNGKVFFAFYLYDGMQVSVASSSQAAGSVTLTTSPDAPATKTLQFYAPTDNEDPFLWAFPDLASGKTYQVHAALTVNGQSYTGDFTYQAN